MSLLDPTTDDHYSFQNEDSTTSRKRPYEELDDLCQAAISSAGSRCDAGHDAKRIARANENDEPTSDLEIVGLASWDFFQLSKSSDDSAAESGVSSPTEAWRSPIDDDDEDDMPIIFLDWDDTLLPTTWVQKNQLIINGSKKPDAVQLEQLQAVAESAAEVVRTAKQYGKVVLVTMAEQGWVELSCSYFVPSLWHVLSDVKIVSAMTSFSKPGVPPNSAELKYIAFDIELLNIKVPSIGQRSVMSIGDSQAERLALQRVTSGMSDWYHTKAIKCIQRPGLEDLIGQHHILAAQLCAFAEHRGDLDVSLKKA